MVRYINERISEETIKICVKNALRILDAVIILGTLRRWYVCLWAVRALRNDHSIWIINLILCRYQPNYNSNVLGY